MKRKGIEWSRGRRVSARVSNRPTPAPLAPQDPPLESVDQNVACIARYMELAQSLCLEIRSMPSGKITLRGEKRCTSRL